MNDEKQSARRRLTATAGVSSTLATMALLSSCGPSPSGFLPLTETIEVNVSEEPSVGVPYGEKYRDDYEAMVALLESRGGVLSLEFGVVDHEHDERGGALYGWANKLATTMSDSSDEQVFAELSLWNGSHGRRGFSFSGEEQAIGRDGKTDCIVGFANHMLLRVSRLPVLLEAKQIELRIRDTAAGKPLCYGGTVRLTGKGGRIAVDVSGEISRHGVLTDDGRRVLVAPELVYGYIAKAKATLRLDEPSP